MRDSIAGLWLYGLILIFMVFMIGFIAVFFNYNKTYRTKTEVVNVIEEYQGLNSTSIKKIKGILSSEGYTASKTCTSDSSLVCIYDSGKSVAKVTAADGKQAASICNVCITREKYETTVQKVKYTEYYYTAQLYMTLTLPVFGSLLTVNLAGTTNGIYYPYDSYF